MKTERINKNPHAVEILRGSFSAEGLTHQNLGILENVDSPAKNPKQKQQSNLKQSNHGDIQRNDQPVGF